MRGVSVYIIESPSDKNIFYGQYIGRLLIEALQSIGVKYYYRLIVSKRTFLEAISLMKNIIQNKEIPFLHLGAHGNPNGIQLTDNTFINWDELKKILEPINDLLNGGLCIGISSCSGFNACRMAMNFSEKLPFFALIGPTKEIPIEDATVAFVTFYFRLLKKESSGIDSVQAMKIASKNENFEIALAKDMKALWTKNLIKIIEELKALR